MVAATWSTPAANDGMLHAFDGGMGADGQMDADGGKERFAYIPSTALGHMGNLLLPNDPTNQNAQRFQHRYYVDGPVTISDTYGSNGWTTSLVGTAGAAWPQCVRAGCVQSGQLRRQRLPVVGDQ